MVESMSILEKCVRALYGIPNPRTEAHFHTLADLYPVDEAEAAPHGDCEHEEEEEPKRVAAVGK